MHVYMSPNNYRSIEEGRSYIVKTSEGKTRCFKVDKVIYSRHLYSSLINDPVVREKYKGYDVHAWVVRTARGKILVIWYVFSHWIKSKHKLCVEEAETEEQAYQVFESLFP